MRRFDKYHFWLLVLVIIAAVWAFNIRLDISESYENRIHQLRMENILLMNNYMDPDKRDYNPRKLAFENKQTQSLIALAQLYTPYQVDEEIYTNLNKKIKAFQEELSGNEWTEQAEELQLSIAQDLQFLEDYYVLLGDELGQKNIRWYYELGSTKENSALKKQIVELRKNYDGGLRDAEK